MRKAARLKLSRASLVAGIATYVAVPIALVFGSIAVGSSSYSAFSSTATNSGSFASGSLKLTTNSNGAVFNEQFLEGITTDAAGAECFNVTNEGTLPATVRIYATTTSNPAMNTYATVQISSGSGALGGGRNGSGNTSTLSCNNYTQSAILYTDSLSNFLTNKTSFSTGVNTTIAPGATVSYRFYTTYSYSIPNTMQNQTSQFNVNWEAQSS